MATTRRTRTRVAAPRKAAPAQAGPFAKRRADLAASLVKAALPGAGPRGTGAGGGPVAAVFASGHEAHRNGDVD